MSFFWEIRRRLSALSVTILFSSMIFYFSYHMVSGQKGVLEMIRLTSEVAAARISSDESKSDRITMEHRVDMLAHSLDVDLLDEQARRILSQAKKGEVIYLLPNSSQ